MQEIRTKNQDYKKEYQKRKENLQNYQEQRQ